MRRHSDPTRRLVSRRAIGDAADFLKSWANKPLQIGAVAPSGPALSRAMARGVDISRPGPVIEIGPGTGPVTRALIEHGLPEERLILVEYDPGFCITLRERFPKAQVVQGDAYALSRTLEGVVAGGEACACVCSLPLITRPEPVRLALIEQAFGLMQAGSPFIQFTYAATSPIPLRGGAYAAHASPRIWRNVPPARVWVYRRSGDHDHAADTSHRPAGRHNPRSA